MPDQEELLARRTDAFETWWQSMRTTWEPLDPEQRADLWALTRSAWYAGQKILRERLEARLDGWVDG